MNASQECLLSIAAIVPRFDLQWTNKLGPLLKSYHTALAILCYMGPCYTDGNYDNTIKHLFGIGLLLGDIYAIYLIVLLFLVL